MRSDYLQGKVALVTGAGRPAGLGQEIARRLGQCGARVLIHDRGAVEGEVAPRHGVGTTETLETVADELRLEGIEISTVTGDLRDAAQVERIVETAVEKLGRIDILVNNAGIGYLFGPLVELKPENWDAVLDVNLRAPALATSIAARHMISQGEGGRIINIASQAAKTGFAFATAYTASKHGLLGLTRSTALELGQHGITVNAICPNHVTTGLGAWQNEFMSKVRGQTMDAYLEEMRSRIPMGRTGTPEDTAAVAAFLCSPEASYITAEAINVSGDEEYH